MEKKSMTRGDKLLNSGGTCILRKAIKMLHHSAFFLIFGLLMFNAGDSFSQQVKTITGKVTDSSGTSLPGVSVVLKGTTNGSITDTNGKYTLTNIPGNATIQFSFVGMKMQEITVGTKTAINVLMAEETIGLEEVVAIGYGTQKKATITGAISEIKTDDIAKNAVGDLSNSIAGRLSGVITVQNSGEPGADAAQLFIRGMATFNDNSPLVLVDGVERDFNHIDPNNIESMSVLKDASATAVYGVRGANGVILITTKRGKESASKFTYSGYYGVQNPIRTPSTLNSYDYARLWNEALLNDDPNATPTYSADDIQKYKDHSDPYGHPDVDWNKAMMRKNAPIQRHSLSMTGGSKTFKYFASFGILDQQGNIPNNSYNAKDYRVNLDADITKTTKISANLSGMLSKRLYPGLTGQYRILTANLRPNISPVKWENGLWGTGYNGGNSVAANYESGYYQNGTNSLQNSVTIDQKLDFLTSGLSVKVLGANDGSFNREKQWLTPYKTYNKTAEGEYVPTLYGGEHPSLYQYSENSRSSSFEAHLMYNKNFGKHQVSGLVLYTQSSFYSDNFSAGRKDYSSSAIDQLFAGPSLNPTNDGSAYESGREGYVGRVTYGYDAKYLMEANFGYNGSENFPAKHRFGFFPSAAIGWVISKEAFLSSLNFINFMKIRASYGEVGNDKIGGRRFLYQQPFYYGQGYVFGGNSALPAQSIYSGGLANTDVTWEKSKKSNIGLDAQFFNSILGLKVDVFYEKRDNILWQRNASVPLTFGAELPVENIAKVDNRGFELELNHKYKMGDFEYSIGGNFTFAQNKIVFQDEAENTPAWQKRTGHPIGQVYGLEAQGLYMTQEQVDSDPRYITVSPRLGDIRYKDINNDGIISELDYTSIGYTRTPQIMYGINLEAKYKGFDLSALIQGASRSSVMFTEETAFEFLYGSGALSNTLGRWTSDGSNPNPTYPRLSLNRNEYKKEGSTYWLRDGSYWRLKNIQLGYSLPKGLLKKLNIENFRIYISGTNLYTHSKFKDWDPESPGGSNYYYPQTKANTIGVNVTF